MLFTKRNLYILILCLFTNFISADSFKDALNSAGCGKVKFVGSSDLIKLAKDDLSKTKKLLACSTDSFSKSLNSLRAAEAEKVLDFITKIRVDPSKNNDQLRMFLVQSYKKTGLNYNKILNEIKTGLSLSDHIKLISAGIFSKSITLLAIIFAFLFMLLFILSRTFLKNKKYEKLSNIYAQLDETDDNLEDLPLFSTGTEGKDPRMAEYYRCIEELGLDRDTGIKEVKKYYRQMIKNLHPDLNPNLGSSDKEKFIKLTKNYDKLIDLHKKIQNSLKN